MGRGDIRAWGTEVLAHVATGMDKNVAAWLAKRLGEVLK